MLCLGIFTLLCLLSYGLKDVRDQLPWDADEEKLLMAQVKLKGGSFRFGATGADTNGQLAAGSGHGRRAKLKKFAIDAYSVTNAQFRRFVRETKYVTEAETYAWSFVHELLVPAQTLAEADAEDGLGRVKDSPHWVAVKGADWRRPEGPESSIKDRMDHPVVHVSYNDAKAYCRWANGRRLPTEKEWEFAARGGLDDEPLPWEEDSKGHRMNGWQGAFPKENTAEDGYIGTAPVAEYDAPNEYGMHNMLGNVWEWCEGGDEKQRPLRGGSFVDSVDGSYNHALRVWTRMDNSPDSGSINTGFRCASGKRNLEEPPKPEPPAKKKARGAAGLDQELIQKIVGESGAEGLQAFLDEQGMGASVMTPAKLMERQKELKEMRERFDNNELRPGDMEKMERYMKELKNIKPEL